MKKSFTVLCTLLAFTLAMAGQANGHEGGTNHNVSKAVDGGQKTGEERHFTKGEVKQVDAARGLIIIHHPPIESLGWEEMTMPFPIVDKALLQGISEGDNVALELTMPNDVATIDKISVVKSR